jgi:Ca2+-binding EF-hand superfamily protein
VHHDSHPATIYSEQDA